MSSDLRPVAAADRIALFDVLRGFALLGILLVNFMGEPGSLLPRIDRLMAGPVLGAFVDSSFYPLFSFLFGLGFAMQLQRARQSGTGASHLYVRRMLALLLIGTLHAVFVWSGDILVTYAITGLLLIPLHRLPQKAILALALLLFVANLNNQAVRNHVENARRADATPSARLHEAALLEEARIEHNRHMLSSTAEYTYVAATVQRWHVYADNIRQAADWLNALLRDVFVFFLVGLLVGRARILHEPMRHRRALTWAAALGFGALIGGNLLVQVIDVSGDFRSNLVVCAGNLGPTTFYIAGITLLFTHNARARVLLSVFAAPGRIGLTNYLMQSAAMTFVSMPYGLGWRPSITIWVLLNLAFFFGVQVPFSRWWIKRYQYGPAEWVWRSLTYGARQPLRIPRTAPVAVEPVAAVM